ncbi:MAG: trigger factor, partial [Candidatus Omnitrophica bacterium CG1_02_49_10]
NIEKTGSLKRRINIAVPAEVVSGHLKEIFDDIAKRASIPGFRQGRAPRDLVEKYYSGAANKELFRRVVPHFYTEAIKKEGIRPVTEPEISDINLEDSGLLSFKVDLEVRPVVKVKPYKGIRIKKSDAVVKDEEVEGAISNLRESYAEYVTIEDRPAKDGDYIVCDIEQVLDGKPIKGEKDRWLVLNTSKDEASKPLIGAKSGDIRETRITLPKEGPKAEDVGKEVTLKVSVKQVKEKKLPELNDEFAKDVGKFDNLDGLKEAVKKDLEAAKTRQADQDTDNQILDKLVELSSFEVPEGLVAIQLERLLEITNKRLAMQGFKKEDIDKQQVVLKDKLRADAVKQMKVYFLLEHIAGAEKISVTDDDLAKAVESLAKDKGVDKKKLVESFEKEGRLDDLRLREREAKTIRFLLDNARIS